MLKYTKSMLLIYIVILSTTGCSPAKIYDVPKQEVVQKVSKNDLYKAIIKTAYLRGWEVKKVEDGLLNAIYKKPKFSVTVAISYTDNSYDIDYKESEGLMYDEKEQSIHKNYNTWVKTLEREINARLISISNGEEVNILH